MTSSGTVDTVGDRKLREKMANMPVQENLTRRTIMVGDKSIFPVICGRRCGRSRFAPTGYIILKLGVSQAASGFTMCGSAFEFSGTVRGESAAEFS